MSRGERRHHKFRINQHVKNIMNTWGYDIEDLKRGVGKPPGYEYWSRRPGPTSPCKESKQITHGIERAREHLLLYGMNRI